MVERTPALFRRFPTAAHRLPWTSLGTLPTPVERLDLSGAGSVGAASGGAAGSATTSSGAESSAEASATELWVKRDDRTGPLYGGNKVRKLEFLLAEAARRGATRLITAGAAGSHHALATAVYGRRLGFEVTLVLFPQPLTDHVRDVLLLDHGLGAELRWTPRMEMVPLELLRARRVHRRERVFVVAPGGSDPVGTLGYVSAALELAEQIEAGQAPAPHEVHVAAGTLGTAAGLALGFAIAGLEARIRAVRITSRLVANRLALGRLLDRTARVLQAAGVPADADAARARIELRHDRLGAGYGHPTAEGQQAAAVFGAAGIRLDPTYTAKAGADVLAAAAAAGSASRAASASAASSSALRPAASTAIRLFWNTLSGVEPTDAAGGDRPDDLPEPFRRYLASSRRAGPG